MVEECGHYSAIDDAGVEESLTQVQLSGFDTVLGCLIPNIIP